MVARKVSLVTGKGSPSGKRGGRGKSQVVSMTGVTNKNAAATIAKKKMVVRGPSSTKRRVAITTSKQPIKINNKTSSNGNGRKVVMNVLHPGNNGSTKSNAAVQLYNTTRRQQNGGGATVNGAIKPLQKTVKNDKVKGSAAAQTRGGFGGGGKTIRMLKTPQYAAECAAEYAAAMGNSSSNTYNTGSKNTTAMATAKLIVSAGSHPKNVDIKQLLGAYEKGWVADSTFALELQKLLV